MFYYTPDNVGRLHELHRQHINHTGLLYYELTSPISGKYMSTTIIHTYIDAHCPYIVNNLFLY